ncbi:MAG TPA: hypothetical protein VKZ63_19155 [Kofleriaceae bacterium]|nr:hypothetical protein [Kofleriaceae bacterium]
MAAALTLTCLPALFLCALLGLTFGAGSVGPLTIFALLVFLGLAGFVVVISLRMTYEFDAESEAAGAEDDPRPAS